MRIVLTRVSDRHHQLEIVRVDGSRDAVELVTREALIHDLVHYAVESALPTQRGFWGTLASGNTIADLNDRTGEAVRHNIDELYRVEGIVGAMSSVIEMPAAEALAKLRWYRESQGQEPADWQTERFVCDVSERMRELRGRWKATPYGASMEIDWIELHNL